MQAQHLQTAQLIGAWTLVASTQLRNGEASKTFGDPPSGQIQYTADGRMSAFLMHPSWPEIGENASCQTNLFFAYAGRWSLSGDEISHTIEFCAIPAKVGTVFVRHVKALSETEIELTTKPEVTKSGNVYQSILVWRKVS